MGIWPVKVRVSKIRDKSGQGIKFNSTILPSYLRKTKSIEEVLPWLYFKGISTGDFLEARHALLGSDAKQCIFVVIGVTEHGRKEFIAIEDGYRESDQSWSELLLCIKAQRLKHSPKLAVGDGSLEKDKDEMFAFYDFPAPYWQHIRTSNPIELTFATVRLRMCCQTYNIVNGV